MSKRDYVFEARGISPLLMHCDNVLQADAIAARRTAIKKDDRKNFAAGDDRCPPDTWKGYLYEDGTHLAIPTEMFGACLLKAGSEIELKGKKTYKQLTQSAIVFFDFYAEFRIPGGQVALADCNSVNGAFVEQAAAVEALGFRLFVKRATIGMAKHVRVRPRFDQWSVRGAFSVVDDQVTDEVLVNLWRIAGSQKGLGDWRPGSPKAPGPFGRFAVEINAA